MARAKDELLAHLHAAIEGGVEVSLGQLFNCAEFESPNQLDRLQELDALLKTLRLQLRPPISVGEMAEQRLLVYAGAATAFGERLRGLVRLGEQVDVEFKSTAFVATHQVREEGVAPENAESEGVLFSLLRTICGFLNKNGGELYIGVEPTRSFCGIEADFPVLPRGGRDFDGWSNRLLDKIRSRFHDANRVLAYIDFGLEEIDGASVCRILVRRRERLSFVKDSRGLFRCFVRQNVRTEEIKIEELPDFIEARQRGG